MRSAGKWAVIGISGLFAAVGGALVWHITHIAPYAFSDSTLFVETARSILQGGGVGTYGPSGSFTPLSISPPLYPLLLALFGLLRVDLLTAARWLDVLLFAGYQFALGLLSYRLSRQLWLAVMLCAVSLFMPGLLSVYSGVMTEPVYHSLALVSLLLLAVYIQAGNGRVLIASAVTAGLAMFSRYVGAAVPLTGFVLILVFTGRPWKQAARNAFLFLGISLLPAAGWVLGNSLSGGPAAGRAYGFGRLGDDLKQLRAAFTDTIWSWIPFIDRIDRLPVYRTRLIILAAVVILLLVFCAVGYRRIRNGEKRRGFLGAWVFAIYTGLYILVFSAAYLINSPKPELSERLLFPVYLGAVMTLLWALYAAFQTRWGQTRAVFFTGVVTIVLLVSYIEPGLAYVRRMSTYGMGYTSRDSLYSETIAVVRQLPAGLPVISNEFSMIHLLVDRPAYGMEELFRMQVEDPFTRFGDDPSEEAQRKFREEGGALVLFNSLHQQLIAFYGEQAADRMEALVAGLYLYRDTSDGAVYFYRQPAWAEDALP